MFLNFDTPSTDMGVQSKSSRVPTLFNQPGTHCASGRSQAFGHASSGISVVIVHTFLFVRLDGLARVI